VNQLPNIISFLRIVLTPVFAYLFFTGTLLSLVASIVVFTIAALTDTCDGYVARRLQATSSWGAFLDPIADKILITTVFICFAVQGLIAWWMIIVIILRDIVVTSLRLMGPGIKTSMIAKTKTVIQFVVITVIFLSMLLKNIIDLSLLVTGMMQVMVALTVYTGVDYVCKYFGK